MNHPKQHGGWAQAARKRGETFVGCTVCGGPKHPRILHSTSTEGVEFAAGIIGLAAVVFLFYTAFIWMLLLVAP